MSELVSAIIPIYNVPNEMLQRCIESIVNQTYKNIEIILVNDGSLDKNNLQICQNYSRKYNNIKYLKQKNKGLSSARNTGFSQATGKWITFIDGDDWIEKEGIEKVVSKIKDDPDIVCFGTIKEYKKSSFKYTFNNLFEDGKVYKKDNKFFLEVLFDFQSNISDVTAKLYNKNFLQENKIIHNEKIRQGVEAFEFNFDAFLAANKIQFLKEYIYHYVYNDKSITMEQNNKSYEQLLLGLESVEKKVLNLNNKVVTASLYNRINYTIVTTAISGYFNPDANIKYGIRKKEFQKFMKKGIIKRSLQFKTNIDTKRKIILFLISKHIYLPIYLLAVIRKIQKTH